MLIKQKITVGLSPMNKSHYEGLGYKYTKQGDKITVDVDHLTRGCDKKVDILCDYCLEDGKTTIFQRIYAKYINSLTKANLKKDACGECKNRFKQEVFLVNYGVSSPQKLKKYSSKRAVTRRKHSVESIKEAFNKREYILLSGEYKNVFQKLRYICKSHPEKERFITMQAFDRGYECIRCSADKKIGSNNVNWIGSRELHEYLRSILVDWKRESMAIHNYQCVISGERSNKLHIHHLISFTKIMNDCLEQLNLDLKKHISDYSDNDLLNLKELCLKKHFEVLGVPVMPDIHYEFHRIYGKGNNTPQQFYEFTKEIKGEV